MYNVVKVLENGAREGVFTVPVQQEHTGTVEAEVVPLPSVEKIKEQGKTH
jgi:hypothetical protein